MYGLSFSLGATRMDSDRNDQNGGTVKVEHFVEK